MSDDLAFPISSKTVLELNFYLNLFSKWLILPCKKEFKTYHYFEDFYLNYFKRNKTLFSGGSLVFLCIK